VVARPDRDPHIVEVRPGTMRKAARADVYLEAGLSLDLWSADIVRGSRNRDLRVIDCSSVITPLDVPQGKIDASMGDVHPQGNPHWWLDPMNGAAVARLLAKELGRVDPAHADAFAANAESFAAEIEKRLPAWDAALRGHTFVEYHASWAYLANRFGMEIAGHVEPLPGIPPTARHLAELADVIRSRHVPIVIRDPYHAASGPEFLERETGVRAVVLPASCDEPTPASYFAHFDRIARTLGAS
jgi:ABC-type Zn uptake system ZnuABC Zn-binding protein ZnuA